MSPTGSGRATPQLGCTCLRLRKAARRVSQIYDRHLEPFSLTITQFGLLAQLHKADGIGIGALAERLIMDPTTLTRNLRPIERRGLVALSADPRDRRARAIRLTDAGRKAFEDARQGWLAAQHHIQTSAGRSETGALHLALDHLLDRLADEPEDCR